MTTPRHCLINARNCLNVCYGRYIEYRVHLTITMQAVFDMLSVKDGIVHCLLLANDSRMCSAELRDWRYLEDSALFLIDHDVDFTSKSVW